MKRGAILMVVAVALGGVLWFKSQASEEVVPVQSVAPTASAQDAEEAPGASLLLFADPREAESSCGCAEVIRLARSAGGAPSIGFREIDTRERQPESKRYGVRVSPTVIILDEDGIEMARFEGESPDVILKLREALSSLKDGITP